jgi:hypothetical protein
MQEQHHRIASVLRPLQDPLITSPDTDLLQHGNTARASFPLARIRGVEAGSNRSTAKPPRLAAMAAAARTAQWPPSSLPLLMAHATPSSVTVPARPARNQVRLALAGQGPSPCPPASIGRMLIWKLPGTVPAPG